MIDRRLSLVAHACDLRGWMVKAKGMMSPGVQSSSAT